MVATDEMRDRLERRGFERIARWSRGVDAELFQPAPRDASLTGRPIFLYVGRVAVEKSIARFLELDLPGTKWIVGDGPARTSLQARFPSAVFHGTKQGRDLAWYYQQADAFVFPSRTDTFGLVLIEAMGCGTPIAAYPVTGPIDVVRNSAVGVLSHDLRDAALKALSLDRVVVRDYALRFSWATATHQFVDHLHVRNAGGNTAPAAA